MTNHERGSSECLGERGAFWTTLAQGQRSRRALALVASTCVLTADEPAVGDDLSGEPATFAADYDDR
jgi:hypothetical protein